MALRYGFPKTDDLQCSNVICREKATCVLHMKDKTEVLYCREHFPMDMVGKEHVSRVEELTVPGERNN